MANTFYVKYGASAPDLITPILADGVPLDLTGAVVELKIRNPFGSTITKQGTVAQDAGDNNIWKVTIQKPALDASDLPLEVVELGYDLEWHITQGGKLLIVPTEEITVYDKMFIQKSLYGL